VDSHHTAVVWRAHPQGTPVLMLDTCCTSQGISRPPTPPSPPGTYPHMMSSAPSLSISCCCCSCTHASMYTRQNEKQYTARQGGRRMVPGALPNSTLPTPLTQGASRIQGVGPARAVHLGPHPSSLTRPSHRSDSDDHHLPQHATVCMCWVPAAAHTAHDVAEPRLGAACARCLSGWLYMHQVLPATGTACAGASACGAPPTWQLPHQAHTATPSSAQPPQNHTGLVNPHRQQQPTCGGTHTGVTDYGGARRVPPQAPQPPPAV
jgi:hypothetical protein